MSLAQVAANHSGWDGHERRHGYNPDYSGPERRIVHRTTTGDHFRVRAWDGDDRRRTGSVTNVDLQLEYLAKLIGNVEDRQTEAVSRMDTMQRELTANTEVTTEVRELLSAAKGGLKVIGGIGAVAKWVGGIGAAGVSIYTLWHMFTHGGRPPGSP